MTGVDYSPYTNDELADMRQTHSECVRKLTHEIQDMERRLLIAKRARSIRGDEIAAIQSERIRRIENQ